MSLWCPLRLVRNTLPKVSFFTNSDSPYLSTILEEVKFYFFSKSVGYRWPIIVKLFSTSVMKISASKFNFETFQNRIKVWFLKIKNRFLRNLGFLTSESYIWSFKNWKMFSRRIFSNFSELTRFLSLWKNTYVVEVFIFKK